MRILSRRPFSIVFASAVLFSALVMLVPFALDARDRDFQCSLCISTGEIINGAITTIKIRDGAVTKEKLADGVLSNGLKNGSVTTNKLADDSVTDDKIAKNSVGTRQLKPSSVKTAILASGAVRDANIRALTITGGKIADGEIGPSKLANGSVLSTKLADGSVLSTKLAGNAVDSSKIEDRSITSSDIAFSTITGLNIASNSLTSSEIGANSIGSSELVSSVDFGTNTFSGRVETVSSLTDRVVTTITSNVGGGGFIRTLGDSGNDGVILSTGQGGGAGLISVFNISGNRTAGIDGSTGNVFGNTKSFLVDDPTDASRMIRYTSIEGPEAAIYVRGSAQLEAGWVIVDLPEHFSTLVNPESITVSLTPRSASSLGLAAVEVKADSIEVWELQQGAGSYSFDYVVYGQRKGFEDYQVYLYHDPDEAMLTQSFDVEAGQLGITELEGVPVAAEAATE